MTGTTDIEWATRVWNPLRGCSRKSKGCRNCYAERVAWRFGAKPGQPYHGLVRMTAQGPKWTGDVVMVPEQLQEPLRVVKPARIFVNSMSDLFHESVPFGFIADVFSTMSCTTRHTYLVLTKRPERMLAFLEWLDEDQDCFGGSNRISDPRVWPQRVPSLWVPSHGKRAGYDNCGPSYPLINVLLGASVEDQETAYERFAPMREIAARGWRTWVSYEPALGPVDWMPWTSFLTWLVCGGESGTGASPMHPAWARSARDAFAIAGKPFFFKQWGHYSLHEIDAGGGIDPGMSPDIRGLMRWDESTDIFYKPSGDTPAGDVFSLGSVLALPVGKKEAGRLLDGQQHDSFPEAQ